MDGEFKGIVTEVSINSIKVSPFQPRKTFSEEEIESLARSIRSVGLIQPPVVREIKNGEKTLYYELIAGERRWRAMMLIGETTIPVLIKASKDQVAAEATLIENIQRVNLNPMETAEAFKKLIDVFGLTQEQIAKKVGKKRSTVANYLRLLSLTESIKQEIYGGRISLGHAKVILMLEDPVAREKLAEAIVSQHLAVRETEVLAKKLLKQDVAETEEAHRSMKAILTPISEERISSVVKTMENYCVSKVAIRTKGSGGAISIHFKDEEDLLRLEKLFSKTILEDASIGLDEV